MLRRVLSILIPVLTAPLLLVLAWVGGFLWYAASIPHRVEDAGSRTDAIVVLTGGTDRVATGLALLAEGRADKLFISGVHRGVDVADVLRKTHHAGQGLEGRIALGYAADDTLGNAMETALWMRSQNFHSMRLVTGHYHMRRSLLEFSHAMPEASIIPHPVFPENVKAAQWWLWPGTAALIASEYNKFLAASVLHGLEPVKEEE